MLPSRRPIIAHVAAYASTGFCASACPIGGPEALCFVVVCLCVRARPGGGIFRPSCRQIVVPASLLAVLATDLATPTKWLPGQTFEACWRGTYQPGAI